MVIVINILHLNKVNVNDSLLISVISLKSFQNTLLYHTADASDRILLFLILGEAVFFISSYIITNIKKLYFIS